MTKEEYTVLFVGCGVFSLTILSLFIQLAVLDLSAADGQGGGTNSKQRVL